MGITDELRRRIAADQSSLYQIARAASLPYSMLHRFANGADGNGATIDALADYYQLELTPRKKQAHKKTTR